MPAVLSLLFHRRVFTVAVGSLIARLPKGMTPLGIVMLLHETTGSYAHAGMVVAAATIGDAVVTPVQGRLIDRFGRGWVLLPSATVYALALILLSVLAVQREPLSILVGAALVAGAAFPPISGSMKALWPKLITDVRLRPTGYAAESLLQQILLLIGPLLATALTICVAPIAVLWTAAAATLGGTALFVVKAARFDTPARSGDDAGGRGIAAVRSVIVGTGIQGVVFGALPVIAPALALHSGQVAAGGMLLSTWIAGGIAGSFLRIERRYAVLLASWSVVLTMVAVTAVLTGGRPLPVAVALGVAGLFLTPIAATSYVIIEAETSPAGRTEAFAWLSTALAVGGAAGSALAGTLVQWAGAPLTLLLPAAAATIAATAARLTR